MSRPTMHFPMTFEIWPSLPGYLTSEEEILRSNWLEECITEDEEPSTIKVWIEGEFDFSPACDAGWHDPGDDADIEPVRIWVADLNFDGYVLTEEAYDAAMDGLYKAIADDAKDNGVKLKRDPVPKPDADAIEGVKKAGR